MPHLISNLVEKSYTPYTARLAPKNLWSRPTLRKNLFYVIRIPENVYSSHYKGNYSFG